MTSKQRKIITETSKRFESLVKAGANSSIAHSFYLASLKIDLSPKHHSVK